MPSNVIPMSRYRKDNSMPLSPSPTMLEWAITSQALFVVNSMLMTTAVLHLSSLAGTRLVARSIKV